MQDNSAATEQKDEKKSIVQVVIHSFFVIPFIISIFAGRSADCGNDPVPEFKKSLKLALEFLHTNEFKDIKIIDARIKNQIILND